MLDAENKIPMQAIRDKGGLWVPYQLSFNTASRLISMGLAKQIDTRFTPKRQHLREKIGLTDKGRAALKENDP